MTLSEKSLYQSAGISHILAISGLHLSLLGELFYFLLRKMRLSSLLSSLISSFFLFSYFLFTGSSHSAFRALLMIFLRFAAIQIGRGKDLLSQLSFALLLLLWLNPLSIYSIGMQCSFFTLFVFFLLQERPGKMVRKKKEKDLAKVLKKKKIVLQKLPSLLSKLISGIFAILPTRPTPSFFPIGSLIPHSFLSPWSKFPTDSLFKLSFSISSEAALSFLPHFNGKKPEPSLLPNSSWENAGKLYRILFSYSLSPIFLSMAKYPLPYFTNENIVRKQTFFPKL